MNNSTIDYLKGTILYLNSVLVFRTCQLQISGLEEITAVLNSGEPYIVTSWHGMTMMVVAFLRKYVDISSCVVIIPDDYRGRALMGFAEHLGVESIQLNLEGDSTLGSGRRLVHLVRKISSGKKLLIHPDGPDGPAYYVKPGLSYLARKTGAAIIPMGCYCRNAYHVPRWDRYTLPVPFSKIHVQIGKPFTVSKDQSDLVEINHHLENTINRVFAQAAANYYEM